jgi:hypothetical protein
MQSILFKFVSWLLQPAHQTASAALVVVVVGSDKVLAPNILTLSSSAICILAAFSLAPACNS